MGRYTYPSNTDLLASQAEPDLGNPPVDGYILSSTAVGVRSWVEDTGGGFSPAAPVVTSPNGTVYTQESTLAFAITDYDSQLTYHASSSQYTLDTTNLNVSGVFSITGESAGSGTIEVHYTALGLTSSNAQLNITTKLKDPTLSLVPTEIAEGETSLLTITNDDGNITPTLAVQNAAFVSVSAYDTVNDQWTISYVADGDTTFDVYTSRTGYTDSSTVTSGTLLCGGFNESNPFGDNSQVVYYSFNASSVVDDDEKLGGDATYNGTAYNMTYGAGVTGQAAGLNGTSSYIATGYTIPANSQITIGIWFKSNATGTRKGLYGDNDAGGSLTGLRVYVELDASNNFYLICGNGSTSWSNNTVSGAQFLNNVWHNATLVINGTSFLLYMDGSLFHTYTSTVAFGTAGLRPITIGRAGDYSGGVYWNGSLDQFRIFNRALTAQEVQGIYTADGGV